MSTSSDSDDLISYIIAILFGIGAGFWTHSLAAGVCGTIFIIVWIRHQNQL